MQLKFQAITCFVVLGLLTISTDTRAEVDADVYEFLIDKSVEVETNDGLELTGVLVGAKNKKIFVRKDDGKIVTLKQSEVASVKEVAGATPAEPASPAPAPTPTPGPGSTQPGSVPSPASGSSGHPGGTELRPSPDAWKPCGDYNQERIKVYLSNESLDPEHREALVGFQRRYDKQYSTQSSSGWGVIWGLVGSATGAILLGVGYGGSPDDPGAVRMAGWITLGVSAVAIGFFLPFSGVAIKRIREINNEFIEFEDSNLMAGTSLRLSSDLASAHAARENQSRFSCTLGSGVHCTF